MSRNQLPEGVGKKIVEALKRQAEADISPIDSENLNISNTLPLTEIEDLPEIQYESTNDDLIIEEEAPVNPETIKIKDEQEFDNILNESAVNSTEEVNSDINALNEISQQKYTVNIPINNEKPAENFKNSYNDINIPANVATLKKLIMGLPAGVTKQTGAQIIKQTFEAMGVPMNNVLKEAQLFQEELNSSTREYMIKIQEYRTQILQLEQSVQEYQKNITQINDLISLFLAADKH